MNLKKYKNIIFDFDGVIVDSNNIKKDAIQKAVNGLVSIELESEFVNYFIHNNGLPREYKIDYYFKKLKLNEQVLDNYNEILKDKFDHVKFTEGFFEYLKLIKFYNINAYIVSGGEITEIIKILKNNHLEDKFIEIKASPKTKEDNIKELDINLEETFFIGDSLIDYKAAKKYNINFVFMYGYSQFYNWKEHFESEKGIVFIKDFSTLLNCRC